MRTSTPLQLFALNVHGTSLSSNKIKRLRDYTAREKSNFLCLQECGAAPPPYHNCLHSPKGRGLAILYWGYYPQKIVWDTPFALFVLFSGTPASNPPPHTWLVVGTLHFSCSNTERVQQLTDFRTWLKDTFAGILKSPPIFFGGDFNCPVSPLDSENEAPPHITHGSSTHMEVELFHSFGFCDTFRYLHPHRKTFTHYKDHTHTSRPPYSARRLDRWYSSVRPVLADIVTGGGISDHCLITLTVSAPSATPWGTFRPIFRAPFSILPPQLTQDSFTQLTRAIQYLQSQSPEKMFKNTTSLHESLPFLLKHIAFNTPPNTPPQLIRSTLHSLQSLSPTPLVSDDDPTPLTTLQLNLNRILFAHSLVKITKCDTHPPTTIQALSRLVCKLDGHDGPDTPSSPLQNLPIKFAHTFPKYSRLPLPPV